MIIIPDVHGRKFWREAVAQREPGEKVIFVGDYVDPYTGYEDVTHDDAFEEFKAILDFKKENPDDVVLELGNHDLYYFDKNMGCCRHDRQNYSRWNKLFTENKDLFCIAYQQILGKYDYLITHAGVHREWLDLICKVFPFPNGMSIADFLNDLYHKEFKRFLSYLSLYSRWRGYGGSKIGSCVWADIHEWLEVPVSERLQGVYQIFGHTRLDEPYFGEGWAMLDARCGFRINSKNQIIALTKNEETRNEEIAESSQS